MGPLNIGVFADIMVWLIVTHQHSVVRTCDIESDALFFFWLR